MITTTDLPITGVDLTIQNNNLEYCNSYYTNWETRQLCNWTRPGPPCPYPTFQTRYTRTCVWHVIGTCPESCTNKPYHCKGHKNLKGPYDLNIYFYKLTMIQQIKNFTSILITFKRKEAMYDHCKITSKQQIPDDESFFLHLSKICYLMHSKRHFSTIVLQLSILQ